MKTVFLTVMAAAATVTVGALLLGCEPDPPRLVVSSGSGPAGRYECSYNAETQAYTGAYATASEIGWEGNHQGVVTCLGGSFYVQDGIDKNFGFGIYDGSSTTWSDADGYLPAQTTTFRRFGATISITEFADQLSLSGRRYVAVYSRVAVVNPTGHTVVADPQASKGMVELSDTPNSVGPHDSVDHDYVTAADRFGAGYPWPSADALAGAGPYEEHYSHMKSFWDSELAGIANIAVPDSSLVNAYKSGFIYTQIARSGNDLNTGVNNYESEFSHDVVGILGNLFTQGYFTGAHALLLEARNVVGSQGQYDDGIWTYAWPWAIYLLKTGDLSFVKENFSTEGPKGPAQPSIEDTAHDIATDRTGPGGIMGSTQDIDTEGFWTIDDYEALMGLAAYEYLAQRVGNTEEAQWAAGEYSSLLSATNATLDSTISHFGLDYLPCSMLEPNTANRCSNPEDANWAAPFQFGKWAWDAQLFGAQVTGPGLDLIDSTYEYGFARLSGLLPVGTFGGFPDDYYSTAYNAGYGSWGLASNSHRDEGILSYEFMIEADQSGPYSWWESSGSPVPGDPWVGTHPGGGQGSSPHAWGISEANKVLLDSLVAQKSDGSLVVGRGVPTSWVRGRSTISVVNFPTVDGRRIGIRISAIGGSVTLSLSGGPSPGPVLFELPIFVNNVAESSAGSVDEATGTVTVAPGVPTVTVRLRSGTRS